MSELPTSKSLEIHLSNNDAGFVQQEIRVDCVGILAALKDNLRSVDVRVRANEWSMQLEMKEDTPGSFIGENPSFRYGFPMNVFEPQNERCGTPRSYDGDSVAEIEEERRYSEGDSGIGSDVDEVGFKGNGSE